MKNYQLLADQWESVGEEELIISRKNYIEKPVVENLQLASDIEETSEKIHVVFNT